MTLSLPRLNIGVAIADTKTGFPTVAFTRLWERTMTAIEETDAAQQAIIEEQGAQIESFARTFRSISHADGLTLVASADGATAKVAVSAHTRVYLDKSVIVNAATLTGLAYGTTYSIFYDDQVREGGAVAYQTTTNPQDAVTSDSHPFRHLVGVVTTPAGAGDPPVDGGGTIPPGFPGGIYNYETP